MSIPVTWRQVLSLSVCLTIFAGSAEGRRRAVLDTTACAVAANPKRFDRKAIRLRAQVMSDGIERTVLFDEECPRTGIALVVPDDAAERRGTRDLQAAILRGHPGTTDKEIKATFTGRFLWSPKKVPARTLSLQEVVDIEVRPKKP